MVPLSMRRKTIIEGAKIGRESQATKVAQARCARCMRPLWVRSGHSPEFAPCPFYPRKRTSQRERD
jgi:hypothetical protein